MIDEEAKSKARKKRRGLLNTATATQLSSSTEAAKPSNEDPDVEMQEGEGDQKAAAESEVEAETEKKDESDAEEESDEEDDHEDQGYETITSRFVERLLKYLFQGFSDAKASVRVRCCQIIALCISSMGELE